MRSAIITVEVKYRVSKVVDLDEETYEALDRAVDEEEVPLGRAFDWVANNISDRDADEVAIRIEDLTDYDEACSTS